MWYKETDYTAFTCTKLQVSMAISTGIWSHPGQTRYKSTNEKL